MKIGVISDTHNFLDPRVKELFQGVGHILHAGDIGMPWLIHELETIAPVTAVLGNTDDAGLGYRLTEVIELGGHNFLVHHIVNPEALEDSLANRIKRAKPGAVVFGHTHKPFNKVIDDILFFNPGAAGKARFGLERTLAILHCSAKRIRPQFITL